MNKTLPKKLLRIKDFTYILPDNFSGSFEDAISDFLKYTKSIKKNPDTLIKDTEEYSSARVILSDQNSNKACGAYGIFELDLESGEYKLVESEK